MQAREAEGEVGVEAGRVEGVETIEEGVEEDMDTITAVVEARRSSMGAREEAFGIMREVYISSHHANSASLLCSNRVPHQIFPWMHP